MRSVETLFSGIGLSSPVFSLGSAPGAVDLCLEPALFLFALLHCYTSCSSKSCGNPHVVVSLATGILCPAHEPFVVVVVVALHLLRVFVLLELLLKLGVVCGSFLGSSDSLPVKFSSVFGVFLGCR
jgi:hypothetical protein